MYLVVAIITVAVAWGFAAIYYYLINSVRFSRWYHWLLALAATVFCAPTVTFIYPNSDFSETGFDFSDQLVNFSIVNLAVTAVLFVIASYSIRWWSSNCRHTPIPE
jgi:hypothetical protein